MGPILSWFIKTKKNCQKLTTFTSFFFKAHVLLCLLSLYHNVILHIKGLGNSYSVIGVLGLLPEV